MPTSRNARIEDPSAKYPRTLIMTEVTHKIVMKSKKRLGRTRALRLMDTASISATPSAPWVTILPTDVGSGSSADLVEYVRTLRKRSPQIHPIRRATEASDSGDAPALALINAGDGVLRRTLVTSSVTGPARRLSPPRRRRSTDAPGSGSPTLSSSASARSNTADVAFTSEASRSSTTASIHWTVERPALTARMASLVQSRRCHAPTDGSMVAMTKRTSMSPGSARAPFPGTPSADSHGPAETKSV